MYELYIKRTCYTLILTMKVCLRTTFFELCLKTFLDKNPAVAAHTATSGASGPRLPPANMVNKLNTKMYV